MEPSTEAIPSWDGNPGGWLRYTLQVSWFVLGTKKSVRPVEAPRLIGQLTLEFLPWTMCDFLVRKIPPYTSAVDQQYFGYKTYSHKSIAHG